MKMPELKLRGWADYTKIKMKPLPDSKEMGQKNAENGWQMPEIDVRSKDISDLDLSAYNMQDITFDDKTAWPIDVAKRPKGYTQLKKIIEYGKNPGLGIQSLHKKGIDGTGLSMAIIDQHLSGHIEYDDNLVHYEEIGRRDVHQKGSMHGSAVASIAVGKRCGVAPKAKLYYFAADNLAFTDTGRLLCDEKGQFIQTAFYYANALKRIVEINEVLPKKERIQVVSVSWGGQTNEKILYSGAWLKALERAKDAGIFVLTCASQREYGLSFLGLGRNAVQNPELPSSYTDKDWGIPADIEQKWILENKGLKALQERQKALEKTIFVPMNHRTVASPTGNEDYVHYFKGGMSWATPWLAGTFLLARQVNPGITPNRFWQQALKTGIFNEEVKGTVIQPEKLIETLQKENNNLKQTLQNGAKIVMKGKQNAK